MCSGHPHGGIAWGRRRHREIGPYLSAGTPLGYPPVDKRCGLRHGAVRLNLLSDWLVSVCRRAGGGCWLARPRSPVLFRPSVSSASRVHPLFGVACSRSRGAPKANRPVSDGHTGKPVPRLTRILCHKSGTKNAPTAEVRDINTRVRSLPCAVSRFNVCGNWRSGHIRLRVLGSPHARGPRICPLHMQIMFCADQNPVSSRSPS